jgi:hypothetical protein
MTNLPHQGLNLRFIPLHRWSEDIDDGRNNPVVCSPL